MGSDLLSFQKTRVKARQLSIENNVVSLRHANTPLQSYYTIRTNFRGSFRQMFLIPIIVYPWAI